MLSNFIRVSEGFQASVNISYDLTNDEKVKNFIPTISAIEIIEDVILSIASSSVSRARVLIGAYGRGKSHIVLVLLSLLFRKDQTLFKNLLQKIKQINPDLYDYILEYLKSDSKFFPIVISGSSSSLTQSFLKALHQSLHTAQLDNLMPETHFIAAITSINNWRDNYPDTYTRLISELNEPIDSFVLRLKEYDVSAYDRFIELYPKLTSGSVFNPYIGFDVVDLYEKVNHKLCEIGYSGIFIVYDEFSKYLESSINNASFSDIKLLQDFAEKCDRSGKEQMHLMLICHKDISNYIDEKLPKEKVDGWRSVSGRFKHVNLQNNYSQVYEIISAVIKKDKKGWKDFYQNHKDKFDELIKRFTANGLLSMENYESVTTAVIGCYPLHPVSAFILPRISEKIAQNERTLFTFLSSTEKNTLSAFINTKEGKFPLLTPDVIYDYFEPILRKEPYTSNIFKTYKITNNVLQKIVPDSLEAKIIKTLSLIYIIEQFERLPPTRDIIIETFYDLTNNISTIDKSLNGLIEKECILYLKRSNNYLKLKESSGIDIHNEIKNEIERLKVKESMINILNRSLTNPYFYPSRYNDEHEITRYFDFVYISSDEFKKTIDWNQRLSQTEADGIIFAIVPNSEEELYEIRTLIEQNSIINKRIVFAVPRRFQAINNIAYEYAAILRLKSLVGDDDQLLDEYDIYIEDLEEVLDRFYLSYTSPEYSVVDFYYGNARQKIYRKAQLSSLLSKICEDVYPFTPIINNEVINKNHLSAIAINSRNKVISGLLASYLEPNLGLRGTGQEVSIMRSTLIQTGILVNNNSQAILEMNPTDERLAYVLKLIEDFFINASIKKGLPFSILYEKLTSPDYGIGLKFGVIPIFIAVVLHKYKRNLIIKHGDNELKITADLLNSINENPEDYIVFIEHWNENKARYISELSNLFKDYIVEEEKCYNAFAYLVSAINRWYMALPKYTKDAVEIYLGNGKFEPLPKTIKRFLNSLRQEKNNPREFLFEKLLTVFDYEELDLAVIEKIRNTKKFIDDTLSNLIKIIIADVKALFGGKKKRESVSSVVRNWYEDLKPETTQHLFPNNENKILELFKDASNNDILFIQKLCKTVTGLRIEDWTQNTICYFSNNLLNFKKTVEEYNKEEKSQSSTGTYRFIFIDNNGNEIIRTFTKSEYSPKAKLLLNDIISALDEMGQSITEQEKRQVLLEVLEKLC